MASNAQAYFEVQISPPKRVKRNVCQEEQEILILAPFKPIPKIIFENIKVNHEATRKLLIRNPTDGDLKVEMVKLPPEERHLHFSATQFELGAEEEIALEIVWTPQEGGSWRDIVPIRTSSKLRTEIVIIYSSVAPCAMKKRKKALTSRDHGKATFITKKPIGLRKIAPASSAVQRQVQKLSSPHMAVATSPLRRQTFLVKCENKENKLPNAKLRNPLEKRHQFNISKRFEDLVLSPISTKEPNQPIGSLSCIVSPLVEQQKRSLPHPVDAQLDNVEGSVKEHGVLLKDLELCHSPIDSALLRRQTYAVTDEVPNPSKTKCLPDTIQQGAVMASLPGTDVEKVSPYPLIPEKENEDDFKDSLEEEADHEFVQPSQKEIFAVPNIFLHAFDADEVDRGMTGTHSCIDTSSFIFNPPLPSEDPRRCSTGIKRSSDQDVLVSSFIRKDLFGEIPTNDLLGPSQSIPIMPVDRLSTETYVTDRLSSETYVKDRLSIESFVKDKDRLSTETYIKDRLSSGTYVKGCLKTEACVKENDSNGSDHLSTDTFTKDHHSNSIEALPSFDIASSTEPSSEGKQYLGETFAPWISPLRCIKEEDDSVLSLRPQVEPPTATTNTLKQTVFQVSPPQRRKLSPSNKLRRSKISPVLKRTVKQQKSPRKSLSSKVQGQGSSAAFPADVFKKSAFLHPTQGTVSSTLSSTSRRSTIVGLPSTRRTSSVGLPRSAQSRLSLSRPKTSQMVAKRQKEKSEFLFDTDDILSQVMNEDPFAASTTSDPFLSCSLYHDNAWKARQERDMIKWLNALLSPPAELETNTDLPRIDVADLWKQTCRQTEVGLAPSREQVSSDLYLKPSRLMSLRKAAISLIKSRSIMNVLQKVAVHVENKLLQVREDRDLHLDMGLKHVVLDLLLCYNPLWLRIGLEAVYGRTVELQSNSDIVGLATFIVHNLLSDDHIVATYSHPTVPHLKLPGFQDAMKKFTLKKFLFIVYFLDQAKISKLIGHDPCLFMRNAKYKDSRDILLAFSRELLAGVGDITRHLAVLGYKLSVKQVFLDEFEYAVESLLDLRDGVRLVRVMELILQDYSLSPKLRVPAISKLQKIHNVDIAFQALSNAGFSVCGGIQAKHLAEGHREKTLSFLWQIIYKFQAPRFTNAASLLQMWWRKLQLGREINRRIQARRKARLDAAATKVQAVWRAYQARCLAAAMREEQARVRESQYNAVIVLQKHCRRYLAQKMLAQALRASNMIKVWYSGAVLTRKYRHDFLTKRKAVIKIQALCRGYIIRKNFAELKRMAAALRIQTWYRRQRMARVFQVAAQFACAWTTENRMKMIACRKIQSRFRALKAMRRQRAQFLALRNAAVVIQKHCKSWIVMKRQQTYFLSMKYAAITIQQRYRAHVAMQVQRAYFLQMRSSAILLKQKFVAYIIMKKERADFLAMRSAALTIQHYFRAYIAMKHEREDFCRKKEAALLIQKRFRATLIMRRLQAEYISLRKATIYVQERWRSIVAMKAAHLHYLALRSAAITLQRRYRAKKEMEDQRRVFLTLRSSAVALQQRYRAMILMRQARSYYENLLRVTKFIQQRWRGLKLMSKDQIAFQQKRYAAITLQRKFRSQQLLKKAKCEFLLKRSAVILLQQWWRGYLAMKEVQHTFILMQKAAFTIQTRWRAQQEMKSQREEFKTLRLVSVTIQRRWRLKLLMRRQRAEYLKLRNAAIFVQRKWRAQKAVKNELSAVLTIQKHFRSYLAMRRERAKFIKLRTSTIVLQRHWRAYLIMRREEKAFKSIKSAAIIIQHHWRAQLLMRRDRHEFLQLLHYAVVVQRRYRKLLKDREDCAALAASAKRDAAAVHIQRYARGYLARLHVRHLRQKCEEKRQLQDCASRKIQRMWREWQKKQQKLRKETAATKIQSLWRGFRVRSSMNDAVKAQFDRCKQAMQETKDNLTLRNRGQEIISTLGSGGESIGQVLETLVSLDSITLISPPMCETFMKEGVVGILYNLVATTNRSLGSKEVCIYITSALVNFVKYEVTADAVWQDGKNVYLLLHLMKVWVGKEDKIFLNCATIIWHFLLHPSWVQVVAEEPRLNQTLESFAVKLKIKGDKKCTDKKYNRLPSVKHTWCVPMQNPRPRTFENPLYALRAIASKLKLTVSM